MTATVLSNAALEKKKLQWVNGIVDGSDIAVADKSTVLQIYTHLCHEVEQLGAQQGVKLGTHVVKEFPPYPDPIDLQRHISLPKVHDALLVGPRKPKHRSDSFSIAIKLLYITWGYLSAKYWETVD